MSNQRDFFILQSCVVSYSCLLQYHWINTCMHGCSIVTIGIKISCQGKVPNKKKISKWWTQIVVEVGKYNYSKKTMQ